MAAMAAVTLESMFTVTENRAPDRVPPPAQPPAAPGTRKRAVTDKLLHNGRAVAYREHCCLRTLTALPGLRQKEPGRADPYPTCSRCRRTPPPATETTTKNTLTRNGAITPTTLTLND
jgi:hypothetical protein